MAQREDYLKKMELKNKAKQDAGIVSERYPNVSGIKLSMTYYHNSENPILMQRTVNVFPTSYAYFNMECMVRGCETGGFDLSSIIKKQIKQKKKSAKGKIVCKGKIGEQSTDHAHIAYEVNVSFKRSKKK
jgi:hypothetical protein